MTHLNRPVNKLYSLEIQSETERKNSDDGGKRDNILGNAKNSLTRQKNIECEAAEIPISDRRKRLRRAAAESGILKRIHSKQV